MDVLFQSTDQKLEVLLRGEVDHHSARGISDTIDFKIRRQKPAVLILDFGEVSFMDSSGLAVVMGRRKLMRQLGGKVELCRLHGNIKKIFDMAEIGRYVSLKEEVK